MTILSPFIRVLLLAAGALALFPASGPRAQEFWCSDPPRNSVDYSGCDLRNRTDLKGADLSNANLSNANLSGMDLMETNFYGAIVTGTDFSRANLVGANLCQISNTFGNGPNFCEANLSNSKETHEVDDGEYMDEPDYCLVRDGDVYGETCR